MHWFYQHGFHYPLAALFNEYRSSSVDFIIRQLIFKELHWPLSHITAFNRLLQYLSLTRFEPIPPTLALAMHTVDFTTIGARKSEF